MLVGAIVILAILASQVNSMSYRHGLWYKKRLEGVKRWAKITLHGAGKKTVHVQTMDGTFRVTPVYELISRTEIVPVRHEDHISFTVSVGNNKRIVEGRIPFTTKLSNITIHVEMVQVEKEWFILNEMEATELGNGGLIHSDRMSSGVDVLLVPGKSAPFIDRNCLELFRLHNMRLHVVYYEDHTFARRDGNIECGFKSGSAEASIEHIRKALKVTRADFCIGYSLGGLLLSLLLKRNPNIHVGSICLVNPFLAMSMHSVVRGLDTSIGISILRMLKGTFPRLKDDTVIPRVKSRFDWVEFMAYKYPINIRNPQRDDPARFVSQCSFNMIDVSISAMLELRSGPKIRTPLLLVGGTQDEVCAAKSNIRMSKRIFENVHVKTFSLTHAIFPAAHDEHDADVLFAIAEFFHSKSHDIIVDI